MDTFQDLIGLEEPLIDAPKIAPLLVNELRQPGTNSNIPQPVSNMAGSNLQLLAGLSLQEDLMVFTPESSPQLAKALPASLEVDRCWTGEPTTRPGEANPVARGDVTTPSMPECIDREAMLFLRPAQAHQTPPASAIGTRASIVSASSPDGAPHHRGASGAPSPSVLARPGSDFPTSEPPLLFTSKGRNIVIANLPADVTPTFILQRIRGGNVANCCLTKLKGNGMAQEETIAVVTFEDPCVAEEYVKALLHVEGRTGDLWKWGAPNTTSDEPWAGLTSAEIKYHTHLPDTPQTGLSSISVAHQYPKNPSTTRCLILSPCPISKLETIWNDLHLPRLLSLPHYRAQVEDIWLDGYQRDTSTGMIASASLHIRYTSIQMAVDTKARVMRKPWARVAPADWMLPDGPPPLRHEADPCAVAGSLDTLAAPVADHEGYAYLRGDGRHHLPLLALSDLGCLPQVLRRWRALRAMVAESRGRRGSASPRGPLAPSASPSSRQGSLAHDPLMSGGAVGREGGVAAAAVDPRSRYCLGPDVPREVRARVATFLSVVDDGSPDDLGRARVEEELWGADEEEAEARPATEEPSTSTEKKGRRWGETWGPGSGATSHYWQVSLAEYLAQSDEQWMAFETCFYVPPEGFNTAETATAKKVLVHWDD